MSPPPSPRLRLATSAVLALTVGSHLVWALLDDRLPRDQGLYYQQVPALWSWLAGGPLRPEAALWRPGAWMELLLAASALPFGPSALGFRLWDALWVGAVVASAAALGRALAGERAGLAAAAATASLPVIVHTGRTGWIHLPEAALVGLALAALARDPGLARRRTAAGVGLLAALAVALRPSGLVWGGLALLGALWAGARSRTTGWAARLVLLLLPALVAAPLALGNLGGYLAGKAAARERYATWLPGLPEQALALVGLALPALALGALALPALWRARPPRSLLVLLLALVLAALALGLGSRAGLDNFPLGFVGLAVLLATAGAARWPRLGLALPLGALAATLALPLAPAGLVADGPLAYARPFDTYGARTVRGLIDQVCPDPRPRSCRVMVDQGLYLPYGEEPGFLELFLAREERVMLLEAGASARRLRAAPDALVAWDCGPAAEAAWSARHPGGATARAQNLAAHAMEPLWTAELGGGCTVSWWRSGRGGGRALR